MKTENQKLRVVVGWNNPKYNAKGLADGFEEEGYKVIRVAADKDLPECSGEFDYHLLELMIGMFPYDTGMNSKRPGYQNMTTYQIHMSRFATFPCLSFPMRYLMDLIEKDHGPIYDMIICQCDLILDMLNVTHKWYYYYTEGYKPTLPINGTPEGVFYAFVGGNESLLRSFPYEYHHWKFCKLVVYGMDKMVIPPVIPAWDIRENDVGFKGLLHFSQHSTDFTIRNVYDERRYYMRFVQDWMDGNEFEGNFLDYICDHKELTKDVFEEDIKIVPDEAILEKYPLPKFVFEEHSNFEAYVPFMLNTKIAINVQGGNGWLNQRMYEALAFKCLLLQNYFPQLNQFGFVDKETCLTFSCEAELKEKILWATTHPKEAEQIAENGHQLFINTKCSWQDRAREMDQIIHTPEPDKWVKFHEIMNQYQREINTFADKDKSINYTYTNSNYNYWGDQYNKPTT